MMQGECSLEDGSLGLRGCPGNGCVNIDRIDPGGERLPWYAPTPWAGAAS